MQNQVTPLSVRLPVCLSVRLFPPSVRAKAWWGEQTAGHGRVCSYAWGQDCVGIHWVDEVVDISPQG